jgi:hypothetical protein
LSARRLAMTFTLPNMASRLLQEIQDMLSDSIPKSIGEKVFKAVSGQNSREARAYGVK